MSSPEVPSPPEGLHTIDGFRELPLPYYPGLATLLGYRGNARFVGFCWQAAGDDVSFDDGKRIGPGVGPVFQIYRNHRRVRPILEPHNIGYSDTEADSLLLLDQQQPTLGIAPIVPAKAFLMAQHPRSTATDFAVKTQAVKETMGGITTSTEEVMRSCINLEGFTEVPVDTEEVLAAKKRQNEAISFLLAWLDQRRET